MGTKNVKQAYPNRTQYIGDSVGNKKEGKGTFVDSDNNRYEGEWHHDMKHGLGKMYMKNGELYIGEWFNDQKNGYGKYFYQNGDRYIGHWRNNMRHGQDCCYEYLDGSSFKGEFINDKKGKGKLEKNGLILDVDAEDEKTNEITPENFQKLEYNNELHHDNELIIEESPKLHENDKFLESELHQHDINYEYSQNIMTNLESSDNKSEIKTLDIGFETLSLIDQIEMMNSLNPLLLNRALHEWTTDDIGEWLINIGLSDYVDEFKKNHINGENLLELKEKELKDDLGIHSVGHRKIFEKSIENLRKLNTKNKTYNNSIRAKLLKFYEKHKTHLRSNTNVNNVVSKLDDKFNSYIYSLGNNEIIEENHSEENFKEKLSEDYIANTSNNIINEDKDEKNKKNEKDETKMKKSSPGRPKVTIDVKKIKNTEFESKDDYADDENEDKSHEKEINSGKKKHKTKQSSSNLKSLEKNSDNTSKEKESPSNKKTEKKEQEDEIIKKQPSSDSSSSTDSSSSSDEESKKIEKKKDEAELKPTKPLLSPQEKGITKTQSKNQLTRGRSRTTFDKNYVLKIFKEVGIGINFLLDHQELDIQNMIGEGGYGEVYYGKWLGQEVAIKYFGKSYSKFHKKRFYDFIKEVEVISNLRHPNILLYMGVCINCPKFPCPNYLMLTEYLEGGSLFDLLHKKHLKLPEDRLILIAEDIALGMNYLHSRKVLHCDLKSSNILVDNNWNIKICDFGLSTVKSKLEKKKNKGRIGTPHWMAPEIMRSEKYNESSDIYSYGMILWEMLQGEIPYNGLSVTQILGSVGYDNYQVPLPKNGNDIVKQIMEKCLDRDRNKRPTFSQIVENLQNKNRGKENKRFVINELRKFFYNDIDNE